MTKTMFPIGRTAENNRAVEIEVLRLVDTRMLIQANSGGGKSWLLRLLAERAAGQTQMLILDPEGEFATLREKVDIALVGRDGEINTDVRAAALLARKLVELRVSAIVDLYDLKLEDRRRFVRLFLEALMNVPRALWHPLLVLVDEAHIFAPERSAGEAESTNAVIALMSQGRKRGFAGILSTQRLSKLHKDAAAEANNVVIGRTWLDTDQQRAGDLLGMDKAARQTLRDLSAGEFYAFGPAFNRNGVFRFKSDPVVTTHPKAGERHLVEAPRASATIQEIIQQIGDLPAQAEQEIRNLDDAKREIARLRRELGTRPVSVETKVQTKIERVETPILREGEAHQLGATAKQIADISAQLLVQSQEIKRTVEVAARLQSTPPPRLSHLPVAVRTVPGSYPNQARSASKQAHAETDVALRAGERKMLQTLAQRYPTKLTRAQLGTLSGFTPSGGTYSAYFSTLKRAGLIVEAGVGSHSNNKDVEITSAGLDYLGADIPPAPQSTDELLAMWRQALRAGEWKMLETLVNAYPGGLTRVDLGEATGFTSSGGTFGAYLSTLRRNGLAVVEGDAVRASETLFL